MLDLLQHGLKTEHLQLPQELQERNPTLDRRLLLLEHPPQLEDQELQHPHLLLLLHSELPLAGTMKRKKRNKRTRALPRRRTFQKFQKRRTKKLKVYSQNSLAAMMMMMTNKIREAQEGPAS
mmetsp:Transcript_1085/g.3376  ORF Transcript_1085/g.3376 Transcript_1085/m.3376 type:complete len:122 (+) Transcript_1085:473-838(+)